MVQINTNEGITIPQDVAKRHAETLRQYRGRGMTYGEAERIADLLDPPLSLRDQVHAAVWKHSTDTGAWTVKVTDAVITVVANWLEAQPIAVEVSPSYSVGQRAHDVRLIRGEAS